MNDSTALPRFNLETMSGIFPGTRPQRVQLLLVAPLDHPTSHPEVRWAQLRWYEAETSERAPKQKTTLALFLREADGTWQTDALLTFAWEATAASTDDETSDRLLVDALDRQLAAAGWRLRTCASCAHWLPAGEAGCCTWQAANYRLANSGQDTQKVEQQVDTLAVQQPLALACTHWQTAPARRQAPAPATPVIPGSPTDTPWRRILNKLTGAKSTSQPRWQRQVLERLSGPGSISAGTESCAVCPGRSVNLGAWGGKTAHDDAETWSVWRCNRCHTFYANHWVDRWVRLDSLETEETIVRVAPAEAFTLLRQMANGAAIAQEGDRGDAFRLLFESRQPLTHQIKHGR